MKRTFNEFVKLRETGEMMPDRYHYGQRPPRPQAPSEEEETPSEKPFVPDDEYDDYTNALMFFGFKPTDKPDLIVARSRAASKKGEEQAKAKYYLNILSGGKY
jgi:hypothetical protein